MTNMRADEWLTKRIADEWLSRSFLLPAPLPPREAKATKLRVMPSRRRKRQWWTRSELRDGRVGGASVRPVRWWRSMSPGATGASAFEGGTQVGKTAGETAEKTLATQSSALGKGGCCSLSRPSDDLKIS